MPDACVETRDRHEQRQAIAMGGLGAQRRDLLPPAPATSWRTSRGGVPSRLGRSSSSPSTASGAITFVARDDVAFDACGYRARHRLIAEHVERQRARDASWDCRITALDAGGHAGTLCSIPTPVVRRRPRTRAPSARLSSQFPAP